MLEPKAEKLHALVTSVLRRCRQGEPLPLLLIPSEWSRCSARCGRGGGIHRRNVTCALLGDGWSLDVDEQFCQNDEKLIFPITEEDCKEEGDCPAWTTDQWNEVRVRATHVVIVEVLALG